MNKVLAIMVVLFFFLVGCAAQKPVAKPVKEETVVVEVKQDNSEQVVMMEDVAPMPAEKKEVIEEVMVTQMEKTFVVSPGDNLYSLCLQNDLYIWQLAEFNGIDDPNMISVGQELKLPSEKKKAISTGSYYKVDIGDNLSTIANEVDKSQDFLATLNNLINKNLIKAGSLLKIK